MSASVDTTPTQVVLAGQMRYVMYALPGTQPVYSAAIVAAKCALVDSGG
jgi:hypothetical protein